MNILETLGLIIVWLLIINTISFIIVLALLKRDYLSIKDSLKDIWFEMTGSKLFNVGIALLMLMFIWAIALIVITYVILTLEI